MSRRLLATLAAVAASLSASMVLAQPDPNIDPSQLKPAMAMVKKMDTNNDGMISKQEFMKAMEEKWNQMDKQKKGMVPLDQAARNMLFLGNQVGAQ